MQHGVYYYGHIQASKILHILLYIILCHTSILLKHVKSNCYYFLSRCFELIAINLVDYYILFNNETIKFHVGWRQRMSYPLNRRTRILVFYQEKKNVSVSSYASDGRKRPLDDKYITNIETSKFSPAKRV